jgi:hypothetical protein
MGSLTLDLEIGRLDPPVGVAKLAYLSPPRVGANKTICSGVTLSVFCDGVLFDP